MTIARQLGRLAEQTDWERWHDSSDTPAAVADRKTFRAGWNACRKRVGEMEALAEKVLTAEGGAGPARTVGDTRQALATLLGIPKAEVDHYAFIVDAAPGIILKFCCDDRRAAAAMLTEGARLLLSEPGESLLEDRGVPPMPHE
jgi:hypothetical protein